MVWLFDEEEYYDKAWKSYLVFEEPIFKRARGKLYRLYASSYDRHSHLQPEQGYCAVLGLLPDGTGAFAVSKDSTLQLQRCAHIKRAEQTSGRQTAVVRIRLVEHSHPQYCNIVCDGDPQLSEDSLAVLQAFDRWCFNWDVEEDADPYGMALMLTSIQPDHPFRFDYNAEQPASVHQTALGDVVLSTPNSDWLGKHIFRPIPDMELTAGMDVVKLVSEAANNCK